MAMKDITDRQVLEAYLKSRALGADDMPTDLFRWPYAVWAEMKPENEEG